MEKFKIFRRDRLEQADSDVGLFSCGFSRESQAKEGQKRGISSKLLCFYGKNYMYFITYKGLF